jgi:uncharacterized protein YvpB
MIAVERPTPEPAETATPISQRAPSGRSRPRAWPAFVTRSPYTSQGVAIVLTAALLAGTAGGAAALDARIAFQVQAQAAALRAQWSVMQAEGIPDSDLAPLEQEWADSQKIKFLGVPTVFWAPAASGIVDRWQAETATIYARDLSMYRAGALVAEQDLHAALGTEPRVQRKARLEALSAARTPGEFAALRADWALETRLVPIDRNIAAAAGAVANQVLQANNLAIRSDPAPDALARASDYSLMSALDRMSRAELLTRNLAFVRNDLQGRLDAAAITQQAFSHAAGEVGSASLYGIDISSLQSRIDGNHTAYGNAATVAEFSRITGDLNQVAAAADGAINTALSTTHVISGVTFYYQDHPLSCEEAATSMALTHQGMYLSQDQILAELGSDRRAEYVDSSGRVRWGNPYETFVGNVNGSESNFTGYGTYYPPLVRIARAHGARIIAYGSMSAATIYARVIAGHPVVAFATWDWAWHPRRDYLSFDGQWIPFIGPAQASHVYTVVGVSPSSVLINDPIRGQYWLSKGSFQAGYSDFNEAIVFA